MTSQESAERTDLTIVSYSPLHRDPRVQRQIATFAPYYEITTIGYGPSPHPEVTHLRIPDGVRSWPQAKVPLLTRRHRATHEAIGAVRAARQLVAGRPRPSIVLANDVNSLPFAFSLDARLGVHADLHEFSPREKEHDPKWRAFVAPYFRWICRTYLPSAASVSTVSPGLAAAFASDYGVEVEVVLNAPDFREAEPILTPAPIRLLHTGAARTHRGLERIVEAMEGLEHVTLDLMLVESEPGVIDDLRRRASHLSTVSFREPVPYTELVPTIADYDVSIVFFPPSTFNLRHTLPNKLFEAIQARNAVVVSPSPDLAALIREYDLGAVATDFTADGLRRVLAGIDREWVDEHKQASHRASRELNSTNQVALWKQAIDRIAGRA